MFGGQTTLSLAAQCLCVSVRLQMGLLPFLHKAPDTTAVAEDFRAGHGGQYRSGWQLWHTRHYSSFPQQRRRFGSNNKQHSSLLVQMAFDEPCSCRPKKIKNILKEERSQLRPSALIEMEMYHFWHLLRENEWHKAMTAYSDCHFVSCSAEHLIYSSFPFGMKLRAKQIFAAKCQLSSPISDAVSSQDGLRY